MKTSLLILSIVIVLSSSIDLFGQGRTRSLEISHLTGNFYVYTTYKEYEGALIPSNSMYVVTDKGVVLFDTPWDSTQFQPLLDSIQQRYNKKVVLLIATHFHDDRTAGLNFFNQKGIATYTSKQTFDLCKMHNKNHSKYYFTKDTTFIIGNHTFQTYYPGEGHTADNIVIWCDAEKILYGGCLVKSTENFSLGNIEDANLSRWPASIKNIMTRFPKP
ncbi:MAG: BlaB/IND/MUS family subclass B1 metallo-beta-lactamase, partial [Bacteroidota bacterium]|nr:BlaB/IND/MUS family subclass B1 metallo-beta-lactamase [Bacteroidota bacterium]